MNAADRAAFPSVSRIVRIGDARWNSEEDALLTQLSAILEHRAREWQSCMVESLLEPLPRVAHGNAQVHLLYGPKQIDVDSENKLQADINGLVFENILRMSRKGNHVLSS